MADSQPSVLASAGRFLRTQWFAVLIVSAIVLVPCFWQRHIQAGDLASHIYNAWLAQLIEHGDAPGLHVVRQWNNVLFDLALHTLGNSFGLAVAARIAVSAAVFIFFWGAFALASASARGAAWSISPCLAMVAYGWTFEMGFFNYYISLGLACFALAVVWRGRGWERAAVLVLVPLIWLAHPLGVLLLICAGIWIVVAERFGFRGTVAAGFAAAATLVAVRFYIVGHYQVFGSPEPRLFFNGADQLLLYGPRYHLPLGLLLIFVVAGVVAETMRRRRIVRRDTFGLYYTVPAQMYGLVLLAIVLLPETIVLPQYAAPAGFLHERLACICGIFACCALAGVTPRKWPIAGYCAAAAVFFFYLYTDTSQINRLENQAEQIAQSLPRGARVLSAIEPAAGGRVFIFHIVDRACIGRCFSYGNYEPGSGQFRVRADPANRFVTTSMSDSFAMQRGEYTARASDLPIWQISRCGGKPDELCVRELAAADINGGSRPPPVSTSGVTAPER